LVAGRPGRELGGERGADVRVADDLFGGAAARRAVDETLDVGDEAREVFAEQLFDEGDAAREAIERRADRAT